MEKKELICEIKNKLQEIDNLEKQIHDLKYEFCKEHIPFKVGDEVEINGRVAVIICVEISLDFELACAYSYAKNENYLEDDFHVITERDFDKIKKL